MNTLSRWIIAVGFVVAGAFHFVAPQFYLALMPPYLPAHLLLIQISGGAEILGGLGVLVPPARRLAGQGLIALLFAVLPANIHVALHGLPGSHIAPWIFWVRIPFQGVLIWWVYVACVCRSVPKTDLKS